MFLTYLIQHSDQGLLIPTPTAKNDLSSQVHDSSLNDAEDKLRALSEIQQESEPANDHP